MKDKFTTIVMGLVILVIIAIIIVFGMMFFEEINNSVEADIENFQYTQDSAEIPKTTDQNIETPKIVEKDPLDELQSANSGSSSEQENTNIDYTNVNVNKYFYNQLNDYSKTIYKAFESNKENMKSGTYTVQLGNSFSDLLSQQNGSEMLGKYYQSAIEAYTYDNPDVFYLSPSKMYLNVETTTRGISKTYNVFINSGNEANYLSEEFSSKQKVDEAIEQIEQVRNEILRNKTGNTYQDIKMIHDYLVEHISYDTSLSRPYIYNIYGAMVQNVCVCEGYARSMKYLLDSINIECTIVIGKGTNTEGVTENHAWNYVKINDEWYAIDTTWDDPQIQGGGIVPDSYKYKYFLVGSRVMNQDHAPNGQFTEGGQIFEYPTLSISNYE